MFSLLLEGWSARRKAGGRICRPFSPDSEIAASVWFQLWLTSQSLQAAGMKHPRLGSSVNNRNLLLTVLEITCKVLDQNTARSGG